MERELVYSKPLKPEGWLSITSRPLNSIETELLFGVAYKDKTYRTIEVLPDYSDDPEMYTVENQIPTTELEIWTSVEGNTIHVYSPDYQYDFWLH